jgi:hypothetical protein
MLCCQGDLFLQQEKHVLFYFRVGTKATSHNSDIFHHFHHHLPHPYCLLVNWGMLVVLPDVGLRHVLCACACSLIMGQGLVIAPPEQLAIYLEIDRVQHGLGRGKIQTWD